MSSPGFRGIKGSKRYRDLEQPQIGEKLDFGDLVRRQMDRCLMNAADEFTFGAHVKALEAMIPIEDTTPEYFKEIEGCSETFELTSPTVICGVAIDSSVIPASKQEVVETDWVGRFQAAINLFNSMGITWRRIPAMGF